MPSFRVRRPRFLRFACGERPFLELNAFLRGEIAYVNRAQLFAAVGLRGEEHSIELEDLRLLMGVSSERWSDLEELESTSQAQLDRVADLAEKGLLLTDRDEPDQAESRQADDLLTAFQWHPQAVSFWAASRNELAQDKPASSPQLMTPAEAAQGFADLVSRHGPPPPAFHELAESEVTVELPPVRGGPLLDLLQKRHTNRSFDRERHLAIETLATVLYQVFGCQGVSPFTNEVVLLGRTSPSGGSLHPLEAYPIVLRVDGLESGLYHYNARRHALDRLEAIPLEELEPLAVSIARGQDYVGGAHVVVLLTVRFFRNFWKYRRSARTLGVIFMDAGHLGQTFYLTATELGLGAFFSGAVDVELAESTFGLDGLQEGAVAVCGCGLLPDGSGERLERRRYDPIRERSSRGLP